MFSERAAGAEFLKMHLTNRFSNGKTDQFAVQNHAEVHQTAHALKGMCGELSADKLRKLCEEIELKAREQNLEIKDTLQKLERLLPQLMAEIKGWLESLER